MCLNSELHLHFSSLIISCSVHIRIVLITPWRHLHGEMAFWKDFHCKCYGRNKDRTSNVWLSVGLLVGCWHGHPKDQLNWETSGLAPVDHCNYWHVIPFASPDNENEPLTHLKPCPSWWPLTVMLTTREPRALDPLPTSLWPVSVLGLINEWDFRGGSSH